MIHKIEKGVFKNSQMQYTDDNGNVFTITAIQDKDFHISIQQENGLMVLMRIPGDIWDKIAWESLTKPKSVFCSTDETPLIPGHVIDISDIDVSKLFDNPLVPDSLSRAE